MRGRKEYIQEKKSPAGEKNPLIREEKDFSCRLFLFCFALLPFPLRGKGQVAKRKGENRKRKLSFKKEKIFCGREKAGIGRKKGRIGRKMGRIGGKKEGLKEKKEGLAKEKEGLEKFGPDLKKRVGKKAGATYLTLPGTRNCWLRC